LVAPHLTVDRLEPMIEIIGWNEKCVQNALKLHCGNEYPGTLKENHHGIGSWDEAHHINAT
jgi:hypothetical protein